MVFHDFTAVQSLETMHRLSRLFLVLSTTLQHQLEHEQLNRAAEVVCGMRDLCLHIMCDLLHVEKAVRTSADPAQVPVFVCDVTDHVAIRVGLQELLFEILRNLAATLDCMHGWLLRHQSGFGDSRTLKGTVHAFVELLRQTKAADTALPIALSASTAIRSLLAGAPQCFSPEHCSALFEFAFQIAVVQQSSSQALLSNSFFLLERVWQPWFKLRHSILQQAPERVVLLVQTVAASLRLDTGRCWEPAVLLLSAIIRSLRVPDSDGKCSPLLDKCQAVVAEKANELLRGPHACARSEASGSCQLLIDALVRISKLGIDQRGLTMKGTICNCIMLSSHGCFRMP